MVLGKNLPGKSPPDIYIYAYIYLYISKIRCYASKLFQQITVQFNLNKQTFSCKLCKMFTYPIYPEDSGVTLLFEHPPSRASEINCFETFSHSQENQLAR